MVNIHEIAHRGWSGAAPENTSAAFTAVLRGPDADLAQAMECDLQITRDGRMVVMHDISLGRTSYGSGFVGDHTWDELSCFDFGAFFGPQFAGQRMMLFSDLLEMVDGQKFLCVELKNPGNIYHDMIDKVLAELAEYPRSAFMVESFNHWLIKEVKERDGSIQTGLIFHDEVNMLAEQCRFVDCQWASLVWTLADPRLLSKLQDSSINVIYWTVNEEWQHRWLMDKLTSARGDVWIATDFPGMTIRKVQEATSTCA